MREIGYNMRILVSGATKVVRELSPHPNLGVLVTPNDGLSGLGFAVDAGLPWAADNAAYSGWDDAKFCRMLDAIRDKPGCLFVVVPDVVADADATLDRWRTWSRLTASESRQPLAFVGQDGLAASAVPWDEFACYFVGGSTEWKMSQASIDLIVEARERGKHVHIGRVNSHDRLAWAFEHGCHSVDGTCYSKWSRTHLKRALDHIQGLEVQRWLL